MSLVLHLNGWPGTGKRTIASIVAARLGARLLDNHVMLNPAEALFEREDPHHAALLDAVRHLTMAYAEKVSPGTPIIATDALGDDEADALLFNRYRTLAARRDGRLMSVVLDISWQENVRRLQGAERAGQRKLTRPGVLRDLRDRYRLLRPADVEAMCLDVSDLAAEDAASASWTGSALPDAARRLQPAPVHAAGCTMTRRRAMPAGSMTENAPCPKQASFWSATS